MDYGQLPFTGFGGIAIGGLTITGHWLIALIVGLIVGGALLIKLASPVKIATDTETLEA